MAKIMAMSQGKITYSKGKMMLFDRYLFMHIIFFLKISVIKFLPGRMAILWWIGILRPCDLYSALFIQSIYNITLLLRTRDWTSNQIGTFMNKFHSHSFFLNHFRSNNNKKFHLSSIDLDKLETLEWKCFIHECKMVLHIKWTKLINMQP